MSSMEFELADEQATQKHYSEQVREIAQRPVHVQGPRNNMWTGTGMPSPRPVPGSQLIGRVALSASDPDLDDAADFYIGETRADFDDVRVFSWASPVACTFFRGHSHHEWCDKVTVIRAFVHRAGELAGFADQVMSDTEPVQPFRRRTLNITAQRGSRVRSLPRLPGKVAAPADASPVPPSPGSREAPVQPVRAVEMLRAQLRAPRAGSLASVLATLQPDQYELISRPAMKSMIIEGHPGTGKTIIASHRASYLVHEDTPEENALDGNILLVGPTIGYTNHVRGVINQLTGGTGRILVVSLTQLMQLILDLHAEPSGPASTSWQDVDLKLGMLARSSIQRLKTAIRGSGEEINTERAYEYFRQRGTAKVDPDWGRYIAGLPEYREARTIRAHLPLLALIRWEVDKPAAFRSIRHVIVDEAQDVTQLEWFLLQEMNHAGQGQWTILGDLNQRRSDHTLSSWQQILGAIGVGRSEAPIRTLQRSYRSTRPILLYASKLLPSSERDFTAFQEDGPAPVVEAVKQPSDLGIAVVRQVDRLLGTYPVGTVAVISADPAAARMALRKAGWAMPRVNSPIIWERNGRTVTVTDHDAARGLEFDAVVVVEPADFPENYGRRGPLYTSLTRANRELAVVHYKPLPDALRRR